MIRRLFSKMCVPKVCDEVDFMFMAKQIVPFLCPSKRKGEAGRIAVIGGSTEYTGAPYFAAISALKVGADLVHVFCTKDSSTVIKSYSPELIVHPLLDAEDGVSKIEKWLERFHVIIVGPGLGREQATFDRVTEIINKCRSLNIPLVIDADGLFLVANTPDIIKDYPLAVLTPNAVEFARLFKTEIHPTEDVQDTVAKLKAMGDHIIVVRKGQVDLIFDHENSVACTVPGSGKRCGGQGDLLSGSLGTFLAWSLQKNLEEGRDVNVRAMIACYGACRLTRECNAKAFAQLGHSMTCTDMIAKIHTAFHEHFE